MAYNSGMPVSSYNDEMDGYGMRDYRDEEGRYRPPPDYIDRNYGPYPGDQGQRRDFDYNHGLNMPHKHGHDEPPFGYGPLPNSENYCREPGPYSRRGPPDRGPDMYDGPPGSGRYSDRYGRAKQRDRDFYYGHSGPPGPSMCNGPDMHHGPPGPGIHNGPDMHHGPHGPSMHNGPDMHHGPPGPNAHNGPNMPHRLPGPNIHDRPNMHHGPLGPNMHNGPHNADVFHGPPGPDVCNGFLGSDVVHGPQAPSIYHGPPVPPAGELHRVPPPGSNITYGPLPSSFHVPPGPGIDIRPPHPGPQPGPDMHMVPPLPGPDVHMGPPPLPGPDVHMGPPPPGPDLRHGPPPGPDLRIGPPPGPLHEIHPRPPHHLSPLYPSIPSSAQPITVAPPQCFPNVVSVPVSVSQKYPSENSSHPPLPPSPPRECRPPTPPSPCPPSPRPSPPRSSLPVSRRVDAYDPAEALFSPTSSNSPELSEKQEESIIKKYVKSAQKLNSSTRTVHTAKFVENAKPLQKTREPKITEGEKPKILEESPTRPNLDARLKLMFGTTTEIESPKKKERKKSPTKPSKPKKGETKEIDRPLSPPPSPFQSRQMYHYWHKVTLKLRKSFSASSIDFVSANTSSSIQSSSLDVKNQVGKANAVNIPPKPMGLPLPKRLPTVPPPNYKSSLTEPNLSKENGGKSESVTRNIHRMHPYKTGVSKGHIVQSSLDSELEIACEITSEDGMSDGDLKNNADDDNGNGESEGILGNESNKGNSEACHNDNDVEMQDYDDPDIQNKTVNIVLSKIINELRNEIQKEVYGTVIDKEIQKFIEKHKS